MPWLEVIFWASAAVVFYTFAGYPLLLLARLRWGRRHSAPRSGPEPRSISLILAARDQVQRIQSRMHELGEHLHRSRQRGRMVELIIISDGSADGTADVARRVSRELPVPVQLVELTAPSGKAAALTAGAAVARGEIVVLADVRQRWERDALEALLRAFDDPEVGAATGRLLLENAEGVLAGVGLYWRFESWLRQAEGDLGSCVGVTGAIAAVRRDLFEPLPRDLLLDDVYWPMRVAMRGSRVRYLPDAIAYDRLPSRSHDEFRRKVRTLAGNYQLIRLLPALLLPWRNPLWWEFTSHKLLRLAAPWALLACLVLSAVLGAEGRGIYLSAFLVQSAFYIVGLLGIFGTIRWGPVSGPLSAAASFLVLNAAAFAAFWVWITGRATRSWTPVRYADAPAQNDSPTLTPGATARSAA